MLTRLVAPIVVLACGGCVVLHPGSADSVSYEELRRDEAKGSEDGWVLLEDVPFVPMQTQDDCGAAALSMVLARWGVDAPAAELQKECAVPGIEGLEAAHLRDAARRRGLSAYLIAGKVEDLEHELGRGRPVLVGLVKTLATMKVAHFEVVVGLRQPDEVAALDPARGLVRDSLPAFAAEWAETKGTTLVIFRPETQPQSVAATGP
jgi:ABC-type bacteriocin/lantibiotic exporter with double-glycine peptidase domain